MVKEDRWDKDTFIPITDSMKIPLTTALKRINSILENSVKDNTCWRDLEQWDAVLGGGQQFGSHPTAY